MLKMHSNVAKAIPIQTVPEFKKKNSSDFVHMNWLELKVHVWFLVMSCLWTLSIKILVTSMFEAAKVKKYLPILAWGCTLPKREFYFG